MTAICLAAAAAGALVGAVASAQQPARVDDSPSAQQLRKLPRKAGERPVVAALRCADYEPRRVEAALRQAIDLVGGMALYVKPGQRVVLKPNLLRPAPPKSRGCDLP